jgi:response regulator RpfG family c-di-GMP phosphodiesterase
MRKPLCYLVDDDMVTHFLVAHHFNRQYPNWDIESFLCGNDFCQKLTNLKKSPEQFPKLIILDLNMPNGNGWDVLSFLENEQLGKSLNTLIFSSSIDPNDKRKANQFSGVIGFLEKPLNKGDLNAYITQLSNTFFQSDRIQSQKIQE